MTDPSPQTLIARLKKMGVLADPVLEAAFLAVPRHLFLPRTPLEQVYKDISVALKRDAQGYVEIASTQPSMTARMLAQLQLQIGQNVLQLGAGSGYTAALIQHIVGDSGYVTTVEIDPATVQTAQDNLQRALMGRVHAVQSDGAFGYAPRASYDRILANASVWDIPDAWVKQLKDDGILVAPLWLDALQYSVALRVGESFSLHSDSLVPCSFIPLRGAAAGPHMRVRVGGSSLWLTGDVARIDGAALHTQLSEAGDIDYLSPPLRGTARKRSFLAYMMLNLPPEFIFSLYTFEGKQLPYGIKRSGFAVITRGSMAFISLDEDFQSMIFGGADAFIAAHEVFEAWRADGMPSDDALHAKLVYRDDEDAPEARKSYRVYRRADHDVHVWLS
jgi:protein-L-isoaspartate(D-aspartate) O-methyltransferase